LRVQYRFELLSYGPALSFKANFCKRKPLSRT
jgi:hypothetical protein